MVIGYVKEPVGTVYEKKRAEEHRQQPHEYRWHVFYDRIFVIFLQVTRNNAYGYYAI